MPAETHGDPPQGGSHDLLSDRLVLAAGGDHAAFADFYDGSARRVFGLVLRVLQDRSQAAEVTQEVYLQAWQAAGRFDPRRGAAIAWLMTLAHRRAVDRVRSSSAERRRDTAHHRVSQQVDRDETAEASEASDEAARVRNALDALPSVQRRAIELAYFGGHTGTEIARLTGTPLGTTKTRIRDGLRHLRSILTETA